MNALILGGTGAMGKHLVDLLSEERIDTYVTSRKEHKSDGYVHYIIGNAHEEEFLSCVLKKSWDVIIDFMLYTTEEFSARVEKLLISTSQYIFLSSARVYSDNDDIINEDTPTLLELCNDKEFIASDEYAISKSRQENILRHSGKRNWTVIRPYITYSEIRLQLGVLEKEQWLYRALHGRTIVFSKDIGEKTTTLTYGYDVANGIKNIIGKQQAFGETYHITAQDSLTWKEVFEIYESAITLIYGNKPKIVYCDLPKFMQCHTNKYQILYDRLYNRRFDNNKVSSFIDSSKFINTKQGLRNCLLSFLENPVFNEIDWIMEANKDRMTHEKTPLKAIPGWKHRIKYFLYRYVHIVRLIHEMVDN
jgi:nucleoside-diphosphate-sugar epimerase